jgi:Methylase involved in ubiquinone/menaquinone biosynthesis
MSGADYWEGAAAAYDERSARHWDAADRLRDFLASRLRSSDRALDIGAGTGSWSLFMAERCARVTALDSSPAMRALMAMKIEESGAENIRIAAGSWPEDGLEPHDLCFCAHAMYGSRELGAFYAKMDATATRECVIVIRESRAEESRLALLGLGIEALRVEGEASGNERAACALHWPSRSTRRAE